MYRSDNASAVMGATTFLCPTNFSRLLMLLKKLALEFPMCTSYSFRDIKKKSHCWILRVMYSMCKENIWESKEISESSARKT